MCKFFIFGRARAALRTDLMCITHAMLPLAGHNGNCSRNALLLTMNATVLAAEYLNVRSEKQANTWILKLR